MCYFFYFLFHVLSFVDVVLIRRPDGPSSQKNVIMLNNKTACSDLKRVLFVSFHQKANFTLKMAVKAGDFKQL